MMPVTTTVTEVGEATRGFEEEQDDELTRLQGCRQTEACRGDCRPSHSMEPSSSRIPLHTHISLKFCIETNRIGNSKQNMSDFLETPFDKNKIKKYYDSVILLPTNLLIVAVITHSMNIVTVFLFNTS